MVRGFPSPKCQRFNCAMFVTGHVPFGSACGCWSLEPGLGRYYWSCKPLEKEEGAVGTVKSCGSDMWLSHISPTFSLWGKNFGPRCDCFCSDLNLNLNSPGLTLHYRVPHSTAGLSLGVQDLVTVHWVTGQFRSGRASLQQRWHPEREGADGRKFRAEVGSIPAYVPLQSQTPGGTWSGAFSHRCRESTGWYPAIINRFVSSIDLSKR